MDIRKISWKDGELAIEGLGELASRGKAKMKWGMASFPPGLRHPAEGMSRHAGTEVSLILEGAFSVETAGGVQTAEAGTVSVIPPGEGHATTALVNSRVFYILFEDEAE